MNSYTICADGPNGQRQLDIIRYGDTWQEAVKRLPRGWYWWRVYNEYGDNLAWR